MNKKALIAMSGGVDSSVAAFLMKEQGYECIGATMKLYQNDDIVINKEHTCCSLDDVEDARAVAHSMGMDHYVMNFKEHFKEQVMDKFVHCYECGITPNPCIDCNRYLKFEYLYKRAQELGMDYVVTGHYAQIAQDATTGRYLLKKAVDPGKDQSYVLYSLTQEQLAHTQFPLGACRKARRVPSRKHMVLSMRKSTTVKISALCRMEIMRSSSNSMRARLTRRAISLMSTAMS